MKIVKTQTKRMMHVMKTKILVKFNIIRHAHTWPAYITSHYFCSLRYHTYEWKLEDLCQNRTCLRRLSWLGVVTTTPKWCCPMQERIQLFNWKHNVFLTDEKSQANLGFDSSTDQAVLVVLWKYKSLELSLAMVLTLLSWPFGNRS